MSDIGHARRPVAARFFEAAIVAALLLLEAFWLGGLAYLVWQAL